MEKVKAIVALSAVAILVVSAVVVSRNVHAECLQSGGTVFYHYDESGTYRDCYFGK